VIWNPATEQARTLFEHAEEPLPRGSVPAGTMPAVIVGANPAHPSNRVRIHYREGGANWWTDQPARRQSPTVALAPVGAVTEWFSAKLPPVRAGRQLDYWLELTRAGQRLASLPADGSWLSVRGTPVDAEQPAGTSPRHAPDHPRWAYDLSFFAALTVDLRPEVLGATAEGYRINFFVKDGAVRGPDIDAVVLPEGGDWMCIRTDGIGMVDISITYKASDSALILERAGGVFDLGPDGYAKVAGGDFTGSLPFYATPTWETAHPDWQWLNRRQGFGVGRVVLEELQVRCDIYLPTVGGPLAGA
jgi:hypothetical protein